MLLASVIVCASVALSGGELYVLGRMYYGGDGVGQSYQKAARWYRAGAELGDPDARFNLADLYQRGLGVACDLLEAYTWFTLAARAQVPDAENALADIAPHLSERQIDACKERAEGIWKQHHVGMP
jgi:TPR repeat protein